jgi:hypothetical protein
LYVVRSHRSVNPVVRSPGCRSRQGPTRISQSAEEMSQIESSDRAAVQPFRSESRTVRPLRQRPNQRSSAEAVGTARFSTRHVLHRDYASPDHVSRLEVRGIPTIVREISHRPELRRASTERSRPDSIAAGFQRLNVRSCAQRAAGHLEIHRALRRRAFSLKCRFRRERDEN